MLDTVLHRLGCAAYAFLQRLHEGPNIRLLRTFPETEIGHIAKIKVDFYVSEIQE